jgi:hypothetical protein
MRYAEIFKKWHFWLVATIKFLINIVSENEGVYLDSSYFLGVFAGNILIVFIFYCIGVFAINSHEKGKMKRKS